MGNCSGSSHLKYVKTRELIWFENLWYFTKILDELQQSERENPLKVQKLERLRETLEPQLEMHMAKYLEEDRPYDLLEYIRTKTIYYLTTNFDKNIPNKYRKMQHFIIIVFSR